MKTKSFFALALAAAILAGSAQAAWAKSRTVEEFEADAAAYKEVYEKASKMQKPMDSMGTLLLFQAEHQEHIESYIDLAVLLFRFRNINRAVEQYKRAKKLLSGIPECEAGNYAKAKFYRLGVEMNLFVFDSELSAESYASSCRGYNRLLGAESYYLLGNFYATTYLNKKAHTLYDSDLNKAYRNFKSAFAADTELELLTQTDFDGFYNICAESWGLSFVVPLIEQYYNSKATRYFRNLGSASTSVYQKSAKNLEKAILISIIDKEFADYDKKIDTEDFLEILRKNFGKKKKALPCIEFIRKFYDADETLAESDLNSLPKYVQDFMPVRYMFKMKNSNDTDALLEEFGTFFVNMPRFYERLSEKAAAEGNEVAAAEFTKMSEKIKKRI